MERKKISKKYKKKSGKKHKIPKNLIHTKKNLNYRQISKITFFEKILNNDKKIQKRIF